MLVTKNSRILDRYSNVVWVEQVATRDRGVFWFDQRTKLDRGQGLASPAGGLSLKAIIGVRS